MAESEVECFSGVKTAQNSKTEGGIERKKRHKNVKLREDHEFEPKADTREALHLLTQSR